MFNIAITDFLLNDNNDRMLNTTANVTGTAVSFRLLSIAKQSLEIQRLFVETNREAHQIALDNREEAHENEKIHMAIFEEILSELKRVNANLEKLNGGDAVDNG